MGFCLEFEERNEAGEGCWEESGGKETHDSLGTQTCTTSAAQTLRPQPSTPNLRNSLCHIMADSANDFHTFRTVGFKKHKYVAICKLKKQLPTFTTSNPSTECQMSKINRQRQYYHTCLCSIAERSIVGPGALCVCVEIYIYIYIYMYIYICVAVCVFLGLRVCA